MPEKILIIDDEAPIRRTVERFCESSGYDFKSVESAEEGVKALDVDNFDAAVVDMYIGDNPETEIEDISGIKLIEQIRERSK